MKKIANMLLAILAVSILTACGGSGSKVQESTEPDTTPVYSVQLEFKCMKNLFFSKYDIDIFVDGNKIGKLDHGATRTYTVELKEGKHTLVVAKEGSSSVDGTIDFTASENTEYRYKLSCTSQQVEIEEIVDNTEDNEPISDGVTDNTNSTEADSTNNGETTDSMNAIDVESDEDNAQVDSTNKEQTNRTLSYSTNDRETAKKGNTGAFSYSSRGKNYDIYWIIDFDEGYVYYFTEGNGSGTCDRLEIESGDLNSVLIITYHDGGDEWSYGLHFKRKNLPDTLTMQDNDGFEYEYSTTNLKEALKLRDSKTIKDY